ncbi:MAG: hypothetical protein ACYDA8_07635 [Deferrisomatales bacterium]
MALSSRDSGSRQATGELWPGLVHAEALLREQAEVLERIAAGVPLAETLAALVRRIEAQADGMFGSILLLNPDGVHVRHGAAPSLPEAFIGVVDGELSALVASILLHLSVISSVPSIGYPTLADASRLP